MIDNIFLDPDLKLDGKTDDEIIKEWEREQEESEQDEEEPLPESITKSKTDGSDEYLHVPAEAFDSISGYDEYSYLADNGLLVAKKTLRFDSQVKMAAEGVIEQKSLNTYNDGDLLNLNWYEAKQITARLGGLMLTPAMLWCVLDYLDESNACPELKEDFSFSHWEWLDGIMVREKRKRLVGLRTDTKYYTHTRVLPGIPYDRDAVQVPLPDSVLRESVLSLSRAMTNIPFSEDDIEPYSGFPKEFIDNTSSGSKYHYRPGYKHGKLAASFSITAGTWVLYMDRTPKELSPSSLGSVARLCLLPDEEKRAELMAEQTKFEKSFGKEQKVKRKSSSGGSLFWPPF